MVEQQVENSLLEHLKRFQAGQDRAERKLDEVIHRLGQLETAVAGRRRDFAMRTRMQRCSACVSIA